MAHSWFIYTSVPSTAAESAVEAMYETLGAIVGEDLAEHLEPGEDLEPPVLGFWPNIAVATPAAIPTAAELRASVANPKKKNVTLEEAALERLAKCVTTIQIEKPQDFDPALVSAVRALFESLGPSVFTEGQGSDLSTSESLLATLAKHPDLASTLRAVAAGELDDDEDLDDEAEEEEQEDDEDEPASDSARPEVLRKILAEIAQHPRARRKAGELLAEAPEIVATFAERLARIGAEPDPAVAKALDVKEREVLAARKALANILRRAENR
jgi:hypothetical protein